MANLAECAIAIAKEDLDKTDGAIRKANDGEKSEMVYKRIYKNKDTNGKYTLYEEYHDNMWHPSKLVLKKGTATITVAEGDNCDYAKLDSELRDKGYCLDKSENIRNITVCDGYRIDWIKLNTYSYDYTPYVSEYEDHITIFFGGRWDFPSSLEDKLWSFGVRWQGAGCEDGMDWQFDDGGNWDFGLRIGSETEYCDGEPYQQHFVEDTDRYDGMNQENTTKGDL